VATFKTEKYDLLLAVYIFSIAVSEFMGAKTFPVAHIGSYALNASVAIFVIPVLFSITDIVVEVHGKERARSIVRSGLLVVFLIMVYSILATALPPTARFASSEHAYDVVFIKSIRIAAASLIAFAASEFFDVYIFSKLREKLGAKALWLRNNVSNFASQLVDSTLFITLAFYAINKGFDNNVSFLLSLIIPYWILKCAMSIIETPLVYWGVAWLRKDDKVA
jgi:uncharacterized integral membrane protein (TIGR00697 family)